MCSFLIEIPNYYLLILDFEIILDFNSISFENLIDAFFLSASSASLLKETEALSNKIGTVFIAIAIRFLKFRIINIFVNEDDAFLFLKSISKILVKK